jgi:uncharacterized small protein (DUF1192 family)
MSHFTLYFQEYNRASCRLLGNTSPVDWTHSLFNITYIGTSAPIRSILIDAPMVSSTNHASNEAGSAVKDVASLRNALNKAQTIRNAITSFASEDGFQILSQLVDSITKLENELGLRDKEIEKLRAQLTASKENHSNDAQKQLIVYSEA